MLVSTTLLVLVSLLSRNIVSAGVSLVKLSCAGDANQPYPITFGVGSETISCNEEVPLKYKTTEHGSPWERQVMKGEELTWVGVDKAEFTLNLQKGMPPRKVSAIWIHKSIDGSLMKLIQSAGFVILAKRGVLCLRVLNPILLGPS